MKEGGKGGREGREGGKGGRKGREGGREGEGDGWEGERRKGGFEDRPALGTCRLSTISVQDLLQYVKLERDGLGDKAHK